MKWVMRRGFNIITAEAQADANNFMVNPNFRNTLQGVIKNCDLSRVSFKIPIKTDMYSVPCRKSKMELFIKIVDA